MDTIRAWKDPEYRKSFEQGALPEHPSGIVSLDDTDLDGVAGGTFTVDLFCIGSVIAVSVAFCSKGHSTCAVLTNGCC